MILTSDSIIFFMEGVERFMAGHAFYQQKPVPEILCESQHTNSDHQPHWMNSNFGMISRLMKI